MILAPCTTAGGLCGRLCPIAGTELQVRWFVWAGPGEDLIPEGFVPVQVPSLCPPYFPMPQRLPLLELVMQTPCNLDKLHFKVRESSLST